MIEYSYEIIKMAILIKEVRVIKPLYSQHFVLGAIIGDAQDILLALCSSVIPGSAWGPYMLSTCKASKNLNSQIKHLYVIHLYVIIIVMILLNLKSLFNMIF